MTGVRSESVGLWVVVGGVWRIELAGGRVQQVGGVNRHLNRRMSMMLAVDQCRIFAQPSTFRGSGRQREDPAAKSAC